MKYQVGLTVKAYRDDGYPNGMPCVLEDGDSVVCICPGTEGEKNAKFICRVLNGELSAEERASIIKGGE